MFAGLISTMDEEFTMGAESDEDTADCLNQSTKCDEAALHFQHSFLFCLLCFGSSPDRRRLSVVLKLLVPKQHESSKMQIGFSLLPYELTPPKCPQHIAAREILYTWT